MLNQSLLVIKNKRLVLPALITLIAFLAYLNAVNNQFVFDDFGAVVNNSFIKDWKNLPSLFTKNYFQASGELSYRPVVTLSYFIDYSIGHLNPHGYHLTNLLIHVLNALLAFFLILQITQDNKIAGVSSLFFSVHPILTEAVNSIGFREDLLCAVFFVLALLFYVKQYTSGYKKTCYGIALTAYTFSLFSKEMAVSLPLIIFVMDFLFPQPGLPLKKRIARYYSGFLFISGGYLMLRFVFLKNATVPAVYPGNSLVTNFLTMSKVIASYIKLWFLPVVLNADYHVTFETSAARPSFLLPFLLLICVILITLRLYFKKQREITFFILWMFITLVPVVNIIPIGNIMAERYLYLPSLGFCGFLGIAIFKFHAYINHIYRPLVKACLIIITIFYFSLTLKRNEIWSDDQTLWYCTVRDTPCSFNAHNNLGVAYFKKGMIDKAIEEYNTALLKASEIHYRYRQAHCNLGIAYEKKGMYDAAIREYENALCIGPKNGDVLNDLGILLLRTGRMNSAIRLFEEAIEVDPNNPIYHHNLGNAYREINMPDKAKAEYDFAERLKSNSAQ